MKFHSSPALAGICMLLACAVAADAAQAWNKDPAKWSHSDIERILNASPWAQVVPVIFHDPEDDEVPEVPLPGPAQAGMGSRGNVSDGKWDGGVAKNARNIPGVPQLSVVVRWDSALPVREALAKSGKQLFTPEQFERDYIITIAGLVPAGQYHLAGAAPEHKTTSESDDDGPPDPHDPGPMLQGLMADSMLATSAGLAIRPDDVKLDSFTGELHFFFPRIQPITLAGKEAIFETKFGEMKVKRRFRLKDMLYRGKLEL
jgi:hypothetical protein